MIDNQSDPGSWQRAIDRGCLEGRVSDYTPPQIADSEGSEADHGPALKPGDVLAILQAIASRRVAA